MGFWDGYQGGNGTIGDINKKASPKTQEKALDHSSLDHHQKKDTFGNTWLITLILCEAGMDLVREEFCSCEETCKNL